MSYAIRDIGCEERFNLMLVKGERDFVLQSFNILLKNYNILIMINIMLLISKFK